jgi:hypothetical protein
MIASPLDKNAHFGHNVALVRLLCQHGGKERKKSSALLEYIWVIL